MISDVVSAEALPALEATLRFAGRRQQLIAGNVANLSTPNYQPRDVDPIAFQRALGEAIDTRRSRTGSSGDLRLGRNREVEQGRDGSLRLHPRTPSDGIAFHDRNNRDIEHLMQDMVENAGMYRVAADLLRSQTGRLMSAIREQA